VEDAFGNVVTTDNSPVTLTLSNGSFEGGSNTAAANAVNGIATFSGLRIDAAGTYTLSATDGSLTPSGPSSSFTINPATATLIRRDTTTQGNWIGTYGKQGYDVAKSGNSYPSYATVNWNGTSSATWASSTTDPRALQKVDGSGRIAASWWDWNSFKVNVNMLDSRAHVITFYLLDWDSNWRSERIQLKDAATGSVLDTQTVQSFHGGVYLSWQVTGTLTITVTHLGGANAVMSGLFFDAPTSNSPNGLAVQTMPMGITGSQGPSGALNPAIGSSQNAIPSASSSLIGSASGPAKSSPDAMATIAVKQLSQGASNVSSGVTVGTSPTPVPPTKWFRRAVQLHSAHSSQRHHSFDRWRLHEGFSGQFLAHRHS
jgi:hypothetical protein